MKIITCMTETNDLLGSRTSSVRANSFTSLSPIMATRTSPTRLNAPQGWEVSHVQSITCSGRRLISLTSIHPATAWPSTRTWWITGAIGLTENDALTFVMRHGRETREIQPYLPPLSELWMETTTQKLLSPHVIIRVTLILQYFLPDSFFAVFKVGQTWSDLWLTWQISWGYNCS